MPRNDVSFLVLSNQQLIWQPSTLACRYRNGDVVNVNDTDRYQGGNSENVALVIRSTDKEDIGNYSCHLFNSVGQGSSEQQIDLDVQCKCTAVNRIRGSHCNDFFASQMCPLWRCR